MYFILCFIFFFDIALFEATFMMYSIVHIYLSIDRHCPRIIKYIFLSVLFFLLFLILRLLSLVFTALWRFIGAVDDPRESLLRALVNYPGVVIRRCAAGSGPSEILTLAEGRSEACTAFISLRNSTYRVNAAHSVLG